MAIQLGYGVGIDPSNQAIVTTSIDIFDSDGNKIGYITNFTPSENRNNQKIRHLDSSDAGRIIELQPGPADMTIAVTGFALYSSGVNRRGLLNRLPGSAGAQFVTLNQQRAYFTIREKATHPVSGVVTPTYYYGCLLRTWSSPKNIGGINVAETASIDVSWVDSK